MPNGKTNYGLIHIFKYGDHWAAIYPMGSNMVDCLGVAFSPEDIRINKITGKPFDCGKINVLRELKSDYPDIPTNNFVLNNKRI